MRGPREEVAGGARGKGTARVRPIAAFPICWTASPRQTSNALCLKHLQVSLWNRLNCTKSRGNTGSARVKCVHCLRADPDHRLS